MKTKLSKDIRINLRPRQLEKLIASVADQANSSRTTAEMRMWIQIYGRLRRARMDNRRPIRGE